MHKFRYITKTRMCAGNVWNMKSNRGCMVRGLSYAPLLDITTVAMCAKKRYKRHAMVIRECYKPCLRADFYCVVYRWLSYIA